MKFSCRLVFLALFLPAVLCAWSVPSDPVVLASGDINSAHTNLKAWLKPESLADFADSQSLDGVSTSFPWKNTRTSGSTITIQNGPLVKRNQANGFPVVRMLSNAALSSSLDFSDVPTTLFLVIRLDTGDSTLNSTSNQAIYTTAFVRKSGAVCDASACSTSMFDTSAWHVIAISGTIGAVFNVYVDGTTSSPLAPSDTSFFTSTALLVSSGFSIGGSSNPLAADIAEIISYGTTALSTIEIDRVGTALARKYGLSWNRKSVSGVNPSVVIGNKDSGLQVSSGGSGVAAGGTVLTISGAGLFPSDFVNDATNLATLKVTVGRVPPDCVNPKSSAPCVTTNLALPAATDCSVWEFTAPTIGTIQCRTPAGAGPGVDITISWQGVPYVLHNWFRYQDPVIRSITPSLVDFKGKVSVTISGSNFGPNTMWTATTAGGATSSLSQVASVEVYTRIGVRCSNILWVSDEKLVCTVPALPRVKQAVDTTKRQVSSTIIVDASGARSSAWSSGSLFSYTNVPKYFTCDNVGSDSLSRSTCYSCCRSACVSETFALGTVSSGSSYAECDSSCISYCGFL